jgi:hypothetical protein
MRRLRRGGAGGIFRDAGRFCSSGAIDDLAREPPSRKGERNAVVSARFATSGGWDRLSPSQRNAFNLIV